MPTAAAGDSPRPGRDDLVLAALDFTPALACEFTAHRLDSGPATQVVRVLCKACGHEEVAAACVYCATTVHRASALQCASCRVTAPRMTGYAVTTRPITPPSPSSPRWLR